MSESKKAWPRRLLCYLHIEDKYGTISLTTIAFGVAMYLLVTGRPISLTELGAFLVAVAGHQVRQALEKNERGID